MDNEESASSEDVAQQAGEVSEDEVINDDGMDDDLDSYRPVTTPVI